MKKINNTIRFNVVLLLMIFAYPSLINAQSLSFLFDFTQGIKKGEITKPIEKNGISLIFRLSGTGRDLGSPQIVSTSKKETICKLHGENILLIDGRDLIITEIEFCLNEKGGRLSLLNKSEGTLSAPRVKGKGIRDRIQKWEGKASSVAFNNNETGIVSIKSVKVTIADTKKESIDLNVSEAMHSTLYYENKSFIIPRGVIARTYKINDNVLSVSKEYHENEILPNATAVVIEAQPGKYQFIVTQKEGEYDEENDLRGFDIDTMTSGGDYYYAFAKGSNGVGFYWLKDDGGAFTSKAHRAYLAYKPLRVNSAKDFITFEVPLAISHISHSIHPDSTQLYNLSGLRVNNKCRGIIIKNGKKYLSR